MLQKTPASIEQMVEWMRARDVDEEVIEVAMHTAQQMVSDAENRMLQMTNQSSASLFALVPTVSVPKSVSRHDFDLWFEQQFWPAYPKRFGSNPKKSAADKLFQKIKSGENPENVMAGVHRLSIELRVQGKLNSQFVPQAITWIGQQRWHDDPAANGGSARTFSDISADLKAKAEESYRDEQRSGKHAVQDDFDL